MNEQYKTTEEIDKVIGQKKELLAQKEAELGALKNKKNEHAKEELKREFVRIVQNYLEIKKAYEQAVEKRKMLESASIEIKSVPEQKPEPELELNIKTEDTETEKSNGPEEENPDNTDTEEKIKLEPEDLENMSQPTQNLIDLFGKENVEAGMEVVANIDNQKNESEKEIVPINEWLKIPVGSIVETEDADSTPEGIQPSQDKKVVAEVEYVGNDYVSLKSEQGNSFRRYIDVSKNFHIYMINRAPEKQEIKATMLEDKIEDLKKRGTIFTTGKEGDEEFIIFDGKKEFYKNGRFNGVIEVKEGEIEIIDSKKLKTEIENIIKQQSKKLQEKNLKYTGLEISNLNTNIKMVANFEGTGLKGILMGKPKFIMEITSENGKIEVLDSRLAANDLVNAFADQEEIDKMAKKIGDEVKTYIEKSRNKEVKRIDIENGNLKVEYK